MNGLIFGFEPRINIKMWCLWFKHFRGTWFSSYLSATPRLFIENKLHVRS